MCVRFTSSAQARVLDSEKKRDGGGDVAQLLDILMVLAIVFVLVAQTFFPPR